MMSFFGTPAEASAKLEALGLSAADIDYMMSQFVYEDRLRAEDVKIQNFYFTFGSDEAFPFQDGYIVIEARSLDEAVTHFRSMFPDRSDGCVNCSFFYSEEEWQKSGMHYVEPLEVYRYASEREAA